MNASLNALRYSTRMLCVAALLFSLGCLMIFIHDRAAQDTTELRRQTDALVVTLSETRQELLRQEQLVGAFRSANRALQKSAKRPPLSTLLAGRSAGPFDSLPAGPWRTFRATWYSPREGVGSGLVTATGTHVRDNWTVAVDPSVIPLGSIVQVEFNDGSTRIYQAQDTGGAIRGNRIDIFCRSDSACRLHGVEAAKVRVLLPSARISG